MTTTGRFGQRGTSVYACGPNGARVGHGARGMIKSVVAPWTNAEPLSRWEFLRRNRDAIVELLARSGADEIRVFGSVARGEDVGRSDIDLLVELPAGASPGGELLTVLALSEELSELLGTRVDVATARTLRPGVREEAIAEAVPL